jgi:ATP synthase protein I
LVGQYTTLALVLPCATAVGYFIGHLLDRWLGTEYLKLVFLLLGIAAGFVQLIRQVQKDSSEGGR